MSRGYELEADRALRRENLTRVWENEHPDQALTIERLVHYASDLAGGNRARLIQISLIIRVLDTMGVSHALLRDAFSLEQREVTDHRTRALVADRSVIDAIEAQVTGDLIETPEPDRYVPDTGPLYASDRRWKAKAAAIDREIQAQR